MSPRLLPILVLLFPAFVSASLVYSLPLIGDYAIVRDDSRATCLLVQVRPVRSAFSYQEVLANVEEVAVTGRFITGKAKGEYFLLDTSNPDTTPQFFSTNEQWTRGLKTAGASIPNQLATPDSLAASAPANVQRPWESRIMRNRLGLSDDEWSLTIQLAGLILAFIIGILILRPQTRTPLVILLGIATNVVAQIFIAGGGGGAFVGFFILPILFVLLAKFGSLVRRLITRSSSPPVGMA